MSIQGRLERTETFVMHFKREVAWSHGNQPHVFEVGQRMNSQLKKMGGTRVDKEGRIPNLWSESVLAVRNVLTAPIEKNKQKKLCNVETERYV